MRIRAEHQQKTSLPTLPDQNDFAALLYGGTLPSRASKLCNALSVCDLKLWRDEWIAAGHRANHSSRTTLLRRQLTEKLFWFFDDRQFAECGPVEPDVNKRAKKCRECYLAEIQKGASS